jgi:hypothetical protein
MRSTQGDELVRVVLTALGARHQMVSVDMNRAPTSRHHATPMITPQHQAADGRWDGLDGTQQSRAHVGGHSVDVTDSLRIVGRHLDDLRRNVNLLAIALHASPPAALAHRQRDLVARPPFVRRPLEDGARHEQQRPVVVERLAGIALNFRQRLAPREVTRPRGLHGQQATFLKRAGLNASSRSPTCPAKSHLLRRFRSRRSVGGSLLAA